MRHDRAKGRFARLIAISVMLVCGALAQANERVIRVGTGDWIPYVDESRPDAGALGRLVTAIFEEAGYRVEISFYPWGRNTHLLKDGALDAVLPYYCSEERQQFAHCSEPLVSGEMVFFHRTDMDFDWREMKDLSRYAIGAAHHYFYGEAFEAAERSGLIKVQRTVRDDFNLRLLEMRRVQLYPQDRAVGYAMIRAQFPPEQRALLTHHPRPLHVQPVHVLFHKGSVRGEHLLEVFNEGLQKRRASGELQRLQSAILTGDPLGEDE